MRAGGEFRVENAMSDTDFVPITATTDHVTGQALLYALTRPDTFGSMTSASRGGIARRVATGGYQP
jgi:hypothetical protein